MRAQMTNDEWQVTAKQSHRFLLSNKAGKHACISTNEVTSTQITNIHLFVTQKTPVIYRRIYRLIPGRCLDQAASESNNFSLAK